MAKHLRRATVPVGDRFTLRCECGWEGHTHGLGRLPDEIDHALEVQFRRHLPNAERRTHLRCDTRKPDEYRTLEEISAQIEEEEGEPDPVKAARLFASQPQIIGTFVMPIGEPVLLLEARKEDGVHYGRFEDEHGRVRELPIGEVTTPEGRVFRLDE